MQDTPETTIKTFLQDAVNKLKNIKDFKSYNMLNKSYLVMLVLFISALLPMPYEFYISLRMSICIGLALFIYYIGNQKEELSNYKYTLLGLIILYNPLFVVHLGDKLIWAFVNVGTLYILFRLRNRLENNIDK